MSFMFNPSPYDEESAINYPKLSDECVKSLKIGAVSIAGDIIKAFNGKTVIALEGYASADFLPLVNLINGKCQESGIDLEVISMEEIYKGAEDLEEEFKQYLPFDREKDPVLLPRFSCHNLRHTFATRLCEADVNIKVIQDTLGHKDIATTMEIYAEATKNYKQKELGKMEISDDLWAI